MKIKGIFLLLGLAFIGFGTNYVWGCSNPLNISNCCTSILSSVFTGCTQCNPGYNLINGTCMLPNCQKQKGTVCTQCNQGYGLSSNGTCTQCTGTTYSYGLLPCKPCPTNGGTCNNGTVSYCKKCPLFGNCQRGSISGIPYIVTCSYNL